MDVSDPDMNKNEQIFKTDGYDPDFYEPLVAIEDEHFWFKSRNELIYKLIMKITEGEASKVNMLEIGCGTGNVLRSIAKAVGDLHTYGMDLFREGLIYAKKRVNASLIQADMACPPFKPVFNIIGLFDVLEHFEDDNKILNLLKSSLAENGHLIISVPAFQSLWSYFDDAGCHYRRYKQEELILKLKHAGYEVELMSYYMATTFPIVWLQRKVLSSLSGTKRTEKENHDYELTVNELKIVPIANGILKWLLSFENMLITKFNMRLPFGTSVIAVAKKKAI